MNYDEPAKTSVGEVARYGYGRTERPCGRLTVSYTHLRARHQGVQGAPAQVAHRGTIESGEVCAAADDTGGSNMLLDLRSVSYTHLTLPTICSV